jgi:ketosteroid isomerase-like protein
MSHSCTLLEVAQQKTGRLVYVSRSVPCNQAGVLSISAQENEMSTEANRQLAMRGYEMFQNGDFAGILEQSTDDIEWVSSEIAQIPFSGTYTGKVGLEEFFSTLGQSVERLLFEPEEFVAERDKVVVTGRARWRVRGNGAVYDDSWVHIFTMRDGKIARFRIYGNSAATVAAITAPGSIDPEDVAASMAH